MSERKRVESAFSVPLMPVAILGSLICGAFYGGLQIPAFRNEMVVRYACCHWVAEASVWLFCIAMVALVFKVRSAMRQTGCTQQTARALDGIVEARHDVPSADTMDGQQWSLWLETVWRAQPSAHHQSWAGQRITEFIARQIKRRSTKLSDEDLRELSDRDADAQHSSHAMIRIICWAMPMLGFLGTVLGISDTLGHMDAQQLASGSQDALNKLTGGLYVAFDTTAVGLILTMVAMFVQFAVQRYESRVLASIDSTVNNAMHECLAVPESRTDTSPLQASLVTLSEGILTSVHQLVQTQAELWRDTISEAHRQWLHLSDGVTETAKAGLLTAIRESLLEYREAMQVQAEELVKLQADGAAQIDSRLQQWQTTISEQARSALRQQQEMNKNAELLQKLLDSSQLVGSMQGPIEATLSRLTDVDRFHDAAVCLAEAVAVLGTQMERYGYLGRQPVRRRQLDENGEAAATPESAATIQPPIDASKEDASTAKSTLWKRRAG